MSFPGIVSTLADQLVRVSQKIHEDWARGKDTRMSEAVARCLRKTLAAIAQLRTLEEVTSKGFSLSVMEDGTIFVRHSGRVLPIGTGFPRHLFKEQGIDLVPAQVLLLDPAVAKEIVEEALGDIAHQEARVRSAKALLVAASMSLDALTNGLSVPAAKASPGTAEAAA
jgi:hypothetical protein